MLTIKGRHHYLWRAVDQEGNTLDVLVQSGRNKRVAKRFFTKLLQGLCYVPRVLVTDKLKSYAAARADILPGVEHRQHKRLNNRTEVSHQPTRQRERERQMRRYKSPRHAQRFLSAHAQINNPFCCRRKHLSAQQYHCVRELAFMLWSDVTQAGYFQQPAQPQPFLLHGSSSYFCLTFPDR